MQGQNKTLNRTDSITKGYPATLSTAMHVKEQRWRLHFENIRTPGQRVSMWNTQKRSPKQEQSLFPACPGPPHFFSAGEYHNLWDVSFFLSGPWYLIESRCLCPHTQWGFPPLTSESHREVQRPHVANECQSEHPRSRSSRVVQTTENVR